VQSGVELITKRPNVFLIVLYVNRKDFIMLCYNTHALLRVAANDVIRFGPLYSYSDYRFENHFKRVKKVGMWKFRVRNWINIFSFGIFRS
jgi:hypothetical protein